MSTFLKGILGFAAIFLIAFTLASLIKVVDSSTESLAPVTKTIAAKIAPTEQRMSFDLFDDNSLRRRAKTVYYLVAADGTAVEVSLGDYVQVKEGQKWTSSSWMHLPEPSDSIHLSQP